MFKWIRRLLVWGLAGALVVGSVTWLAGGRHAFSYLRSSGKMLRTTVKDSIPVGFEIQRAKDLLDELEPELRKNLRLVAQEETEVANLDREIAQQAGRIESEREKVSYLRRELDTREVSYEISGLEYSRAEVVEELARRFEHLRTSEMLLNGKRDLLRNRKRSLDAALKRLEKTRVARLDLESQIKALEAQFLLLEAQSTESEFHIDDSKLAQTHEIIGELKKRLEVSQRLLAHEAKFIENIPIEHANETAVVEKVDDYLQKKEKPRAEASRAVTSTRLD
jgi:chromosome segregation ATPase